MPEIRSEPLVGGRITFADKAAATYRSLDNELLAEFERLRTAFAAVLEWPGLVAGMDLEFSPDIRFLVLNSYRGDKVIACHYGPCLTICTEHDRVIGGILVTDISRPQKPINPNGPSHRRTPTGGRPRVFLVHARNSDALGGRTDWGVKAGVRAAASCLAAAFCSPFGIPAYLFVDAPECAVRFARGVLSVVQPELSFWTDFMGPGGGGGGGERPLVRRARWNLADNRFTADDSSALPLSERNALWGLVGGYLPAIKTLTLQTSVPQILYHCEAQGGVDRRIAAIIFVDHVRNNSPHIILHNSEHEVSDQRSVNLLTCASLAELTRSPILNRRNVIFDCKRLIPFSNRKSDATAAYLNTLRSIFDVKILSENVFAKDLRKQVDFSVELSSDFVRLAADYYDCAQARYYSGERLSDAFVFQEFVDTLRDRARRLTLGIIQSIATSVNDVSFHPPT